MVGATFETEVFLTTTRVFVKTFVEGSKLLGALVACLGSNS